MSKLVNSFFSGIVRFRYATLVGALLVFLASLLPLKNLYILQSQEMWLPDADNVLAEFNDIREWFGPNQYLIIGMSAADEAHPVYNPKTLTAIKEITQFLDGHELVVKVNSLSNHQYMESGSGSLWLRDTVTDDDYHRDTATLSEEIHAHIAADPLSRPAIINQDENTARISALITYRKDDVMQHVQITNDLEAFIKEKGYQQQGIHFEFSGFPYIAAKTTLNNMKDQSTLLPALLVLLVILLRIFLGRWAYTWIPVVLALMTTVISLGFIGLMGYPLTMVNASLPLIIIAISVVDAVHLINHFNGNLKAGNDARQSAINTGIALWRPCWFTSLTTILGFISLSVSNMLPVKQYGYASAFAILIAYVLSVTLLIAWLSFIRKPANPNRVTRQLPGLINRVVEFAIKNYRMVLVVTVLVVAVFASFATQVKADANYLHFFRANSPVATGNHFFDQNFEGANSLEFALDSGKEDGTLEPDFLQRAYEFQTRISALDHAGNAQSLLNHLLNLKRIFTGHAGLPESLQETAQYLFFYASNDPIEDLSDLRSFDGRYFRVSLPVKNTDASDMKKLLNQVDGLSQGEFSDLNITVSGDLYLQHKTEYYIQANLVQSFSVALGTIIVCLLIVFRSVKTGLLSLIPSLTPLIIASGLMAVFNVYLDFGTMIVAAITIGIAVDDTIHIINDYTSARKSGMEIRDAIKKAIDHAGLAVMLTSIILLLAFIVMSFSSFMPNVYFGVFSAVIIIGALVSNLLFLPAILIGTEKSQNTKQMTNEILES
ncbi:efflux RND transporter permease subunit [Gynuella sunshinyii]|uniref:Putative exporter of the RND superfamily n=1 Tax=Gynuella sunshinyii YC6258 TaxID=1445510 RepID=A0A0C5VS62_9GAMM|nr:MMPL family transporter [Gynuella sunshinyii]AJQ97061.1 putative exporter of the RND superfamily [Gynuella sunshinyii YC6258]